MAKTYRSQHDDDDARNILKDGERMRVPMYAMDSSMDHLDPLQRAVVRDRLQDARITDGAGDGGLALHRPGYRVADGIPRDHSHYAIYDEEMGRAYLNVGAVESEVRGQREEADSKLSDAMRDEREAAHQEYQNRIQNAWRDG